ncbi:neutral amino acid uniporter 4-like isoform X2 [Lycorma delicatula]
MAKINELEKGTVIKMNQAEESNKKYPHSPSEVPLLTEKEKIEKKQLQIDPHASLVKHPTSYLETLVNLVKGNSGAGMFAMGDAFKNAGLALGPILTIFLGIICVYGNHILVNTCKVIHVKKKLSSLPTFADTVHFCFEDGPERLRPWAQWVRVSTFVFITITQLGFCCVYFIFISSTFKKVLEPHGISVDVHIFMAIILIPILLTALVRNLKFLTPFSFIANICLMSGVVLTLYISCSDLPSVTTRNAVANWNQLPLFFGTTIYAFEGISLVLPLQHEMRNPEKFDTPFGVLNIGMSVITGILISIGFTGYLKYGDDVKGSLTLNLPQKEIFSEVVQLVISFGILLSYTLQFYVPVTIVWPIITEKYGPFKRPILCEKLFRTFVVLIT